MAGDQDAVDVGLGHETLDHRCLVHADADGRDHPLAAQLLESGVRLVDRDVPVVIRVVDQGNVDAVQPHPLAALLERAADTVAAEVPDTRSARGTKESRDAFDIVVRRHEEATDLRANDAS